MTRDVAVVVQTHWDREWYYPHQTFLARLLRVMRQVVEQLDCGELHSFLFDGQVSAIEDFYTHAEPELAERVRAHVQAGRIVIGPWYIMADEFLCAGESLVRNLELGMSRAARHGRCQKVGYLPDTFGHISQMPQILQGFGIDNAVAWRGIDAPQSEILWRAPDGSAVVTVFLTEGYYQHPFNTEDWLGNLNTYLGKIVNRSSGCDLLLTQGGDHLLTVEGLQQKIDVYNQGQSDFRLVQRGLEEYVRSVQSGEQAEPLSVVVGELRDNQAAFVLPDVLSTRQYLKAQNQLLEDLLTGLVEPLLASTAPAWTGQYYPQHYLEQTWQLLIEQHAHDSICGCSVDEVHREMEVRFSQLHQRMVALTEQALQVSGFVNDRVSFHRDGMAPSPFADDSSVTLFNPSPKPRCGWQQVSLFLAGDAHDQVVLETDQGKILPSLLMYCEAAEEFQSPIDDFPDVTKGHRYTLAVQVELAGLEMLRCSVKGAARDSKNGLTVAKHSRLSASIENSFYRLLIDGNQLVIEDKQSGKHYRDALSLVSEQDGGDTYNFSPVDGEDYRAEITSFSMSAEHAIQVLELRLRLTQPAGLDMDRKSTSERVESTGVLTLRLMPGDDYIDCQLEWDNRARDQRLRLQLSLGEHVSHAGSDSAFAWIERPKIYADSTQVSGQQESPVAVFPSQSAVSAGPVGFLHRGLQEAELVQAGSEDRLAITLVRSVGWLSRRDLKTRGLGAGPDLATPEAQCLRKHQFQFAFSLRNPSTIDLLNRADSWRKPVTLLRGGGRGPFAQLELQNATLQVSSLRRVQRQGGPALELRVWNPESLAITAEFNSDTFVRTDLAGCVPEKFSVNSRSVGSHQIATFVFPVAKLPTRELGERSAHVKI
uniref:glycoside hydrolase family 38 N-terminal domain-containing protein n=1 Tax=Microbulbifer agarilyticus TaxID=260552 RepID=UPI0002558A72|nr:glycoside hydrolase family 38 C-terminal domain-containing protein [Microbulbifer agarilyticus]